MLFMSVPSLIHVFICLKSLLLRSHSMLILKGGLINVAVVVQVFSFYLFLHLWKNGKLFGVEVQLPLKELDSNHLVQKLFIFPLQLDRWWCIWKQCTILVTEIDRFLVLCDWKKSQLGSFLDACFVFHDSCFLSILSMTWWNVINIQTYFMFADVVVCNISCFSTFICRWC